MSNKHDEFNEEQFAAFLADAAQKVKTEEDPLALTEYRKIFKKNVPFSLRMYVAAYFAKMMYESGPAKRGRRDSFRDNRSGRDSRGDRNSERNERRFESESRDNKRGQSYPDRTQNRRTDDSETPRQPSRRVVIDESLATTLFVGIGRNRRVFPRDLVSLLIQVAGLERERIGDIRVLDNYSFVQLFREDSEKVINALNGYEYRGRKLSVSYSRKKEESTTDETVSVISDDVTTNSTLQSHISDSNLDAEDAAAFAAAEAAFAAAHPDQVIGLVSHDDYDDNEFSDNDSLNDESDYSSDDVSDDDETSDESFSDESKNI